MYIYMSSFLYRNQLGSIATNVLKNLQELLVMLPVSCTYGCMYVYVCAYVRACMCMYICMDVCMFVGRCLATRGVRGLLWAKGWVGVSN